MTSRRAIVLISVFFSLIVLLSLIYNFNNISQYASGMALTEARSIFDLNLAYRRWNADHGGVYVPVTDTTQPNPYLSLSPRRDLLATNGTRLTLVNPAMMTRQVHAILTANPARPIINKVTSLKFVNPANAPDEWEARALRSFEAGRAEASELTTIGGLPYMRLLKPYFVEKGCLTCHAAQGYELGDVRGGLSVGVPMRPYLEHMASERRDSLLRHLVIWVFGLCGIGTLGVLVRRAEKDYIREKNLAESAAVEWAATFDAIHDCIMILDPEYRILRCNAATTRLCGRPEEQLRGRRCWEIMHDGHMPAACPAAAALVSRKTESTIIQHLSLPCMVATDPILDASGKVVKIVHTIRDLTEQRKLEAQLFQAQKMEAVGTLAGGVAHDFNNILSAIVGYASLLEIKTPREDPRRTYVENILAATERAANLTKSLLSFGRKQTAELKPVSLNEIVSGFQKILARLIGEDIVFTISLFPGDLVIEGDRGLIEQVLMNLATNARDAMANGGRLTIRTDREVFDRDSGEIAGGSYAVIAVSDSGPGMDKVTQEHLFEPFYTTKDVGKGTGLGLAIVYGIVKKHNAAIHVYSEQGIGTTFKIFVPISRETAKRGQQLPAPVSLPAGSGTILLVEDDVQTKEVARILLEECGYTVLMASDGEEGLRVFREHGERIELVLTDLIMPKKNGREAFEEMNSIRPGVKAIFMSGYSMDIIEGKGLLGRGMHFLSKPLNPTELIGMIRSVLGQ